MCSSSMSCRIRMRPAHDTKRDGRTLRRFWAPESPRVPDRIVREAATVILVDLPVPELQERLKQGKIYPPEQARRALDNFFRAELLVKLRELALLQTADYSGRHVTAEDETSLTPRIAVALPFDPAIARALILRGSRLAGR